jgi:UDP-N-acetylglucosamine transferase subunit ALG13
VLHYSVVTPARDEAANLPRLAECLIGQTMRPSEWVIVDDGSTDTTGSIAKELARRHAWVRTIDVAGESVATRGGPVVRALHAGIASLAEPPDVLVKLDADVSLTSEHFERLLARFAGDPLLGMASGSRHEFSDGEWRQRYITGTSVEGQCRAYRWACLGQVSPLEERLGWDGLDEMKANTLGWTTRAFRDLPFRHHREMAERDRSRVAAWVRQGRANHYMGYRPSYAVLRSLYRSLREPSALGLLWGYAGAALRRVPRCPDRAVREHARRQQAVRHLPIRAREALGVNESRSDVLLISDGGGHLFELAALREAWEPFSRTWVTVDVAGSRSLLSGERVTFVPRDRPRSVRHFARHLALALRVLPRERPVAIVTTGGALAVPFAWVGRLLGSRVIYVECGGRADRASLTCRLIAPIADRVYVQWPHLVQRVRGSRYVGRVSLARDLLPPEPVAESLPESMSTLVTVGTVAYQFDRLLRVVDKLPEPHTVLAQTGVSGECPQLAHTAEFLTFEELATAMKRARTVITHAGIGSILLANACGKRPIVVPRLHALGEQIDDHQVEFAQRLAQAGLVTLVDDPERLPDLVARDGDCTMPALADDDGRLAEHLCADLAACRTRRGARSRAR